MYSSIYKVQSSTKRLPIQALFGFTLKQSNPIHPLPSQSLLCGGLSQVLPWVTSGLDCALFQTQGHDEVKAYLDSCYIFSVEAAWRFFKFGMHLEWPLVYCLSVHLKNQQLITYQDNHTQAVLKAAGNRDTTLTGWFKANLDAVCIEAGVNDYLYQDFPKKFVWKRVQVNGQNVSRWKPHQHVKAIGHMYSIPPTAGECFIFDCCLLKWKVCCMN